jgi:hypothetical protein
VSAGLRKELDLEFSSILFAEHGSSRVNFALQRRGFDLIISEAATWSDSSSFVALR